MKALVALLLLLVGCSNCGPVPTPAKPVPIPGPIPTPPPAPDGPATCAALCDRMKALGCDAGVMTKEGNSCEKICLNIVDSGVIKLDLECMVRSRSCNEMDQCDIVSVEPPDDHLNIRRTMDAAQEVLDAVSSSQ